MAENYVGEIRIFAGNFAPQDVSGWHLCDGSLLKISDYNALYAVLGTTYGGDGVITFGLPDLRGRLPVGQGDGQGLTPRPMGQSFGAEQVTVRIQDDCAHSHVLMASSGAATSATANGNVLAATTDAVPLYDLKTNPKAFDARAVAGTGNDQSHPNTMPSLCVSFIIATEGLFPLRK